MANEISKLRYGLSLIGGIDDTPVDGQIAEPISSNWAFDHAALFGLHTKTVTKTADETVNNSTTLQNDDALLLAMAASEVWQFEIFIKATSSAVADFKLGWSVPTGTTMRWKISAGGQLDTLNETQTYTANMDGTSGDTIVCHGIIMVSTTAGNVVLQWAQNTAEVSNTVVEANSCIIATKLA